MRQILFLLMVLALVFGAAGCDQRTSGGETVGQTVDRAIEKTNESLNQAGDRIGEAARSAEQAAKKTAGEVSKKAGQVAVVIDDSVITAAIKADLLKDPLLNALQIDVNTVNGEVTVKGDVDSDISRERVGRIVATTAGVRKVNNAIRVKATGRKVAWTIVFSPSGQSNYKMEDLL